jgi:hypothetical protein
MQQACYLRKVYKKKLTELALQSIIKCQRLARSFTSRTLRKKGFFYSTLVLDNSLDASKVEVFGEFSRDPWQQKIECE